MGGKKPNSLSFSVYHSITTGFSRYSNLNSFYGSGYNTGYGGINPYAYQNADSDKHLKVSGVSLGFGKRLRWPDDWFQLYLETSYQRYDIKNWTFAEMSYNFV